SYGEDNYLNCEYSKAMVEGYQGDRNPESTIISCVKHFAGYGAPVAGREYNTVELGERSLRQDYLPAYKAAIDAGCELVMTSFNTIDGIPVTANEWALRDILRKEWGFKGVVISDHSAVKELVPHGIAKDAKEAAKLAMLAGCDIDMMTASYSNHLKELVDNNELDISYIDEAVMRVLELKNKLGLFENPYRGANEELEKEVVMCDDFRQLSREVVSKTCVLLKNDSVLPLNKNQKVALVGPYASNPNLSGMWSFNADTSKVITVLSGFKEYTDLIQSAKGSPLLDDDSMFESFGYAKSVGSLTSDDKEKELEDAIKVAKDSDVVVVAIGEHAHQSGEGGARGEITIPDVQLNLLKEMKKLGKPVITLVFSGRPLALKDVADNSDAILQCWFPGTEGGAGIADVIYGKVNPSARLSMTSGRPATTSSHSKRFTSRYIDIPNEPYYCFGYGLSYSEFEYSDIQLDNNTMNKDSSIVVSVDVKNTSNIDGEETVQLYIRDLFGSVVRPVKELKGIKKILIPANETRTVTFTIDESMLRFIRKDMNYASEPGDFEVFVGHDSLTQNKKEFTLES
ncbi:MAG: glycoside hydrolase family 3 C-terminal domain-containing protein, partial [Coprobacillus sp.]